MAKELGAYGICINTLAPGSMPLAAREQNPATLPGAEDRSLGRVGIPTDAAGTLVYLLSEDSDFVTGQMILVNGGPKPGNPAASPRCRVCLRTRRSTAPVAAPPGR